MNRISASGCPPPAPKCSGSAEDHLTYQMRRIYIRDENRVFVPVGWICPRCHEIKLDEKLMLPMNY